MSELPEPPIPLSEIGPIPPPPMFSTPSPTAIAGRSHSIQSNNINNSNVNSLHTLKSDFNEYEYEEEDDESELYRFSEDVDSEEEYILQKNVNTMRVEEIPVKEPLLNAVPKKSALKKKISVEGNTSQTSQDQINRPLVVRQDNNSYCVR